VSSEGLISAKDAVRNDFEEVFNKYDRIAVWGAGGKGIAALSTLLHTDKITFVIDSDPHKQNRYLPGSAVRVVSPDQVNFQNDIDAIVITNLAYTDEVLNFLTANNFKGDIATLSRDGISFLGENVRSK
jgi:hypothetical protein